MLKNGEEIGRYLTDAFGQIRLNERVVFIDFIDRFCLSFFPLAFLLWGEGIKGS